MLRMLKFAATRAALLLITTASLVLLSVGMTFAQTSTPTPRENFSEIDNYIVYYGEGHADELARYDAAIIQPQTLPADELLTLTESTHTIAYLSVGEVEPYRDWYSDGRVDESWILGENGNWGSYYINAAERGWQDLMIDLAGQYIADGFDGIFLDTVDTVDLFPDTRDGMIELIARLRESYPDAIIVQNRGFSVLEETVDLIDAVMFEDLSTTYDFETQTYGQIDPADNQELLDSLIQFHTETGLIVLALDYVDPDDADAAQLAQSARATALDYGFISSIAEITLQEIPDYGG